MTELLFALEIARKAAAAGAGVVRKRMGDAPAARIKGEEKGLVTDTDLESEKVILEILSAHTTYPILSEESGKSGNSSGPVWVVDPLDGTNNFARSLPFFAVSVGLISGNQSLVGVIADPVNQKEYFASQGNGAFCNGKPLKLHPYPGNYLPLIFLNHGYAEADRKKYMELSKRLAGTTNILKLGTTALELGFIASGSADAFICSGDELWDFAAGMVIACEAGVTFTDWQGKPWDGKGNHLLFCHPELHAGIVATICDIQ